MRRVLVPTICALIVPVIPAADAGAHDHAINQPDYTAVIDPTVPNRASFELVLPPRLDSEAQLHLFSRAASLQTASQVEDVRCDGVPIEPDGQGTWPVPADCLTASWAVIFDAVGHQGVSAAAQRSVAMDAGWWLFSGPSSLLRMEPAPDRPLTIGFSVPGVPDQTTELPSAHEPPFFFVLGDAPTVEVDTGSMRLSYVADDIDAVAAFVDLSDHAEAIGYFAGIIGEAVARPARPLTVVWLGVPRAQHQLSGAAGHDTLLANYILAADGPSAEEYLFPLVIVFHEQFHQIDGGTRPQWVSESLAHYYALKAARRILSDQLAADAVWDRFVDPDRPIELGLLDVQRQIERGVFDNYGLFYTQGASFWAEIDHALSRDTGGARDLDDILADILAADFDDNEALPGEIAGLLSVIRQPDLDRIMQTYLASPGVQH